MRIKTLGLFGNPDTRGIAPALQFFRRHCADIAVDLLLLERLAEVAGDADSCLPQDELARGADVLIALGGDGTMLRAAHAGASSGTPLLGINLGSLGYLTDVPYENVEQALSQLLAGEFHLEERSRVTCSAWRDGSRLVQLTALNDMVVNMGPLPRALDMEVCLDGESLGRFLGDGLIVSTPTGSTAYNLSAGGPICHTGVSCLLLTPICAHTLGMRPLIVSTDIEIELYLHEVGQGAVLSADGTEAVALHDGDHLTYQVADCSVHLVKFPQSNIYRVMRHKLNWGAPTRRGNGW
jgi:NAD+ kinase